MTKPNYKVAPDLPTTRGKGQMTGRGLKPGINEADTFGVVNQVKGTVSFGRMTVPGRRINSRGR